MGSRELDADVHEALFGHTHRGLGNINGDGYGVGSRVLPLPHYSTDIAAAWLVVEKLGLLSFYQLRESVADERPLWQVGDYVWDNQGRGEFQVVGEGPTAPEAICRAALKAVRGSGGP